jgi:hypothetical protein
MDGRQGWRLFAKYGVLRMQNSMFKNGTEAVFEQRKR